MTEVKIADVYSSYLDEIERLQKKLEIATKSLKRIHQPTVGDIYNFETDELDHTKLQDIAYKALKEIDLIGASMAQAKEER